MKIKVKIIPCGKTRQLESKYITQVDSTEYGALIHSYIESRDKTYYHEVMNTKEEVESKLSEQ